MSTVPATTCYCQVCTRRVAQGEPPFEGVSVMREMHITEADLGPPPKRTSKTSEANAVTHRELDAMVEAIAEVLEDQRSRRKAQVAALEARINMLEARSSPAEIEERLGKIEQRTEHFRYCGVWQPAGSYQVGNFCTFDGSLWHCNAITTERPGTSNAWQLCTKGQDAEARRTARSSR